MNSVDIPEDLRHLIDFPTYDASFQDGPKFRQCLSHWALKTDKVAATLRSSAAWGMGVGFAARGRLSLVHSHGAC